MIDNFFVVLFLFFLGVFSDMMRIRFGRRKLYILFGVFLVVLMFVFIFVVREYGNFVFFMGIIIFMNFFMVFFCLLVVVFMFDIIFSEKRS